MKIQEQEINKMNFSDKMNFTRQERALQKHSLIINKWKKTMEIISEKIKKNSENSLINKSEEFRKKKEIANALHVLKTQAEIKGDLYWKDNLGNREICQRGESLIEKIENPENKNLIIQQVIKRNRFLSNKLNDNKNLKANLNKILNFEQNSNLQVILFKKNN